MTQATYQGYPLEQSASGSAPLITLFERDDAIAVPLLSQLRMAGYDVRSSRTPVELFDTLSKQLVALVLVDLGAATAGRREFWVALDAQRRGRAIQVMTFRFITPHNDLDLDYEPSARAIADIEVRGAHEFQRVIDGVRQRVPLHGPAPVGGVSFAPNGGIQPLGAALGIAPTPFTAQNSYLFNPPAATPASGPANWGGIAPLGVSPFGSPLEQGAPPGGMPQGFPPQSMPPNQMGAYGSYGVMSPMSPQFSAQMETTPFDPANPPYASPASSPFAHPTPSNPFGPGSSPFAQPYGANPFSGQIAAPTSQPPFAQPPSDPRSPAWQSGPSSFSPSAPASFPPGFPQNSAPSAPHWGSGGYLASPGSDPSGYNSSPSSFGSGPTSFGSGPTGYNSDPSGFGSMPGYNPETPSPFSLPSLPPFQDAWSPPDAESEIPTGVVPEIDFQRSSPAYAAAAPVPSDAWETMRGPVPMPAAPAAYIPPRSQLTPDAASDRASRAMTVSTPTETALGGVLVDGALLTPSKLETLKGIQAMLAGVNIHRKLGELALLFKFLSSDQLLAALLVSRGLVSPQQIASLGRVKQELAASGMDNDLETLLISFHILPADKVRQVRAELAS